MVEAFGRIRPDVICTVCARVTTHDAGPEAIKYVLKRRGMNRTEFTSSICRNHERWIYNRCK